MCPMDQALVTQAVKQELSRRTLLKHIAVSAPVILFAGTFLSHEEIYAQITPENLDMLIDEQVPKDPANMTPHEAMHVPLLSLPPIAEDGAIVPCYVEVKHPMEPDHYIQSVDIQFFQDPVVTKGKFTFTPANGEAYLSTQVRIGISGQVVCIAECNQHGKWVGVSDVKVTVGGC